MLNFEVVIRKRYESRISTSKVSPACPPRRARFISTVFPSCHINVIEIETAISPSVPGLFPLYFHLVDLNVIVIETAISPSLPAHRGGLGLFPLYFACPPAYGR
jgi:hypothetical protein